MAEIQTRKPLERIPSQDSIHPIFPSPLPFVPEPQLPWLPDSDIHHFPNLRKLNSHLGRENCTRGRLATTESRSIRSSEKRGANVRSKQSSPLDGRRRRKVSSTPEQKGNRASHLRLHCQHIDMLLVRTCELEYARAVSLSDGNSNRGLSSPQ
jgi:hypothetical protein